MRAVDPGSGRGGASECPGGTADLVAQMTARGNTVDRLAAETLKDIAAV